MAQGIDDHLEHFVTISRNPCFQNRIQPGAVFTPLNKLDTFFNLSLIFKF